MHALILLVLSQHFEPMTLATDLRGGYQVLSVDLNKDGKPDLIGLAQGMDRLDWFENLGVAGAEWKRHTMLKGLSQPINVAAMDVDGDGIPEVMLAHEFSSTPTKSKGTVSLLTHDGDPTSAAHLHPAASRSLADPRHALTTTPFPSISPACSKTHALASPLGYCPHPHPWQRH